MTASQLDGSVGKALPEQSDSLSPVPGTDRMWRENLLLSDSLFSIHSHTNKHGNSGLGFLFVLTWMVMVMHAIALSTQEAEASGSLRSPDLHT